MGENETDHTPVTFENCQQVGGPFYHGTKAVLRADDELVPALAAQADGPTAAGRGHIA
jgi:rifampin ADP-ribosylating transferase